ncbi:hypothetical protein DL96DRAFT_1704976 [Flagelloscypha sp. PMI_526]|nr:hypothetical protein DL96DRAFT_1704976 [Flagelloscypha sp. PMI_526]
MSHPPPAPRLRPVPLPYVGDMPFTVEAQNVFPFYINPPFSFETQTYLDGIVFHPHSQFKIVTLEGRLVYEGTVVAATEHLNTLNAWTTRSGTELMSSLAIFFQLFYSSFEIIVWSLHWDELTWEWTILVDVNWAEFVRLPRLGAQRMRIPPTPRPRPIPLPFDPNPPPFAQTLAAFPFRLDQILSEDTTTYLGYIQFPFRSILSVLDLSGQGMVDFYVGPEDGCHDGLQFVQMLMAMPAHVTHKHCVWSIGWDYTSSRWTLVVGPAI